MNQAVYEAIVNRLAMSGARETELPREARVIGTVVRVLTEPVPTTDQERQDRIEATIIELTLLAKQMAMLDALGIANPLQKLALEAATALMFGLDLARVVANAASPLDVSVVGA